MNTKILFNITCFFMSFFISRFSLSNEPVVVNLAVNVDSVFTTYCKPAIDNQIYMKYTESVYDRNIVYIATSVFSDDNGKATSIICNPLYNVGNNFIKGDTIWNACINSIKEASENWVFKPLYTIAIDDTTKFELFDGYQSHLIIFEFYFQNKQYLRSSHFTNVFLLSVP